MGEIPNGAPEESFHFNVPKEKPKQDKEKNPPPNENGDVKSSASSASPDSNEELRPEDKDTKHPTMETEKASRAEAAKAIRERLNPAEIKMLTEKEPGRASKLLASFLESLSNISPRARQIILLGLFSTLSLIGGFEKSYADEPIKHPDKYREIAHKFKAEGGAEALVKKFESSLGQAALILGMGRNVDIDLSVKRGSFGPAAEVVMADENKVVINTGIHTKNNDQAIKNALDPTKLFSPDKKFNRAKNNIDKLTVTGGDENVFNNLGLREALKRYAEDQGLGKNLTVEIKKFRGMLGPQCEVTITDENGKTATLGEVATRDERLISGLIDMAVGGK